MHYHKIHSNFSLNFPMSNSICSSTFSINNSLVMLTVQGHHPLIYIINYLRTLMLSLNLFYLNLVRGIEKAKATSKICIMA